MNDEIPQDASQDDNWQDQDQNLRKLRGLEADMGPEGFGEWVDEMLKNERWKACVVRQERQERVHEFVGRLHEVPSGRDLPAGFSEEWDRLLTWSEEESREEFALKLKKSDQIDRFVRRGWCVIDEEKGEFVACLEQPAEEDFPIPVVLVFDGGQWHFPPHLLEIAIRQHPFARAVTDFLPPTTDAEAILRKIEWARKLWASPEQPARSLGEAAEYLDLALLETMSDDPAESKWLSESKELNRFWSILNAAIGFGRRLALHDVFRGGAVDEATRRALLIPPGKKPSPERRLIESLMKEFSAVQTEALTAKRLLKWLGASKLGAADECIQFPESSRGRQLGVITWPQFQELVKSAKRKGK